jgi:hypothetical protein
MYSRFVALRVRHAGARDPAGHRRCGAAGVLAEWPESESEPVQLWLYDMPVGTPLTTLVRLANSAGASTTTTGR